MRAGRVSILPAVLGLLAAAALALSPSARAGLGPPASITLAPNTATNTVGTQHCVTATVRDQFGTPVNGTFVTFQISGAHSGQATFQTGPPNNPNGQARACYTGQVVGNDTIRATAGSLSTTASKTWVAANVSLTPSTATNVVGTQHCVTATVTGQNSAPVAGVAVAFQVSGANSAQGSNPTDTGGQAVFCYTGQNVGNDTITATAAGGVGNASKTWTTTPSPVASVSLAPTTTTGTIGKQRCVTATVSDQNGAPLSGIGVTFQVSGANSAQGSKSTDANGKATFCYVGKKSGDDTVTATADNVSTSATKTWIPRPALGRTVNVGVVSGKIRIRERGQRRFHPLTASESIPVGSSVDATRGTVRLFAAKKGGGTQSAVFFDGRFSVHQGRRSTLTDLRLEGGDPGACGGAARRGKGSSRVLRRLWGHGRGRTRTSGNNGSGTVRGTFWLTEDRCDGTFFKVRQGIVAVRDFTRHRTVVLHAGQHYLAPAP